MQEFTVEEIFEGLLNRDTNVLDYIYDRYFYPVKVFIGRNSGTDEDAKDVYQDAILVIYQKVKEGNLTLSCSFSTYLYSVCRLLWLKQLERRKTAKTFIDESGKFVELGSDVWLVKEKMERYNLYVEHFNRLSYNCQKILELFLARIPLKEIAEILGLKGDQYVKKRKHQCKEKLVGSIKKDARFKEITENIND